MNFNQIDELIDQWWDQWRGHPTLDKIFYASSNLGDFSLIWHIVGGLAALPPGKKPNQALRFSALMGVESLIVNQLIKRQFNRSRPGSADDNVSKYQLREPITSSFPSGHASAAFCAATVLARQTRIGNIWFVPAAFISMSRVHVRLHHASDLVGGALIGSILGKLTHRFIGK